MYYVYKHLNTCNLYIQTQWKNDFLWYLVFTFIRSGSASSRLPGLEKHLNIIRLLRTFLIDWPSLGFLYFFWILPEFISFSPTHSEFVWYFWSQGKPKFCSTEFQPKFARGTDWGWPLRLECATSPLLCRMSWRSRTLHGKLTEHKALRHKLKSCTIPFLYRSDLIKSRRMLYHPDVCNCTMPYVPRTVPAYAVRNPAYTAEVFALTLVEIDVNGMHTAPLSTPSLLQFISTSLKLLTSNGLNVMNYVSVHIYKGTTVLFIAKMKCIKIIESKIFVKG